MLDPQLALSGFFLVPSPQLMICGRRLQVVAHVRLLISRVMQLLDPGVKGQRREGACDRQALFDIRALASGVCLERQRPHRDYALADEAKLAYSFLLGISPLTSLIVWPGSHLWPDFEDWTLENVPMQSRRPTVLLLRAGTTHNRPFSDGFIYPSQPLTHPCLPPLQETTSFSKMTSFTVALARATCLVPRRLRRTTAFTAISLTSW